MLDSKLLIDDNFFTTLDGDFERISEYFGVSSSGDKELESSLLDKTSINFDEPTVSAQGISWIAIRLRNALIYVCFNDLKLIRLDRASRIDGCKLVKNCLPYEIFIT